MPFQGHFATRDDWCTPAVVSAFEKGLKSLADLPGHSVGITQVGSTFHYSLGVLAQKRGFDLASMRLVPLQSIPNMVG